MSTPIANNTEELQELLQLVNELPEAGSGDPVLQDKTVSPTTAKQTVTPDNGYDGLSSVTVNAMPTAEQATPSVSVSSSGLITASATQTAGYVSAGTKSGTKQLTTQAAKTITPSRSSQTAVASGVYTTGAVTVDPIPDTYVQPIAIQAATTYTPTTSNQTIATGTYCFGTQTIEGDPNLLSENIAEGVSIFGVLGSLVSGSGGGLPSGISAIETGTFTPTSDVSSSYTVNHNLGVKPNFYFAFVEGGITDPTSNASSFVQGFGIKIPVGTNGFSDVHAIVTSGGSFSQQAQAMTSSVYNTFFKTTSFPIWPTTGKLKAGVTYRWVAGVLDGIS